MAVIQQIFNNAFCYTLIAKGLERLVVVLLSPGPQRDLPFLRILNQ